MELLLDKEVQIIFKDDEGNSKRIDITIEQLIDKTSDDLYEMLEDTHPCTSSSCNTESQNFCDCGSNFDNYKIQSIGINNKSIL